MQCINSVSKDLMAQAEAPHEFVTVETASNTAAFSGMQTLSPLVHCVMHILAGPTAGHFFYRFPIALGCLVSRWAGWRWMVWVPDRYRYQHGSPR